MDQFATALEHRLRTYFELISSRFGCLRKQDMRSSQEMAAESNLVEVYKDSLDVSLGNELEQFAGELHSKMNKLKRSL